MRKFTVEIKPLTPIWTGDADRKVTTLRETGIIGSLRWWYEALIRGYGGFACDPTGTNEKLKCKLDEKKFKELLKSEKSIKKALDKSGICSACQLFGCTGWSRRFRLEIDYKEEKIPLFFVSSYQNKNWLHKITEGQNEILWSKDPIKLNFIPMNNDKDFELEDIIKALIFIISRYGGLGAKLQYGFGQFDTDIDKMTVKNGVQLIKNNINEEKDKNPTLISFSNFFMMKFRMSSNNPILKEYMRNKNLLVKVKMTPERWDWNFIPCAFDIKYKGKINDKEFGLREYFRQKYDDEIVKDVFGYSNLKSNAKKGSDIFVSHLYKDNNNGRYYLKVYGFLNENFAQKFKTEIKLNLKEKLGADIEEEVSGKELMEGLLNDMY